MQFRKYAQGDVPPAKGSIVDCEEESASRALIVRKLFAPEHLRSPRSPYRYSMVAYHGPRDHSAIKAMRCFREVLASGRSL